MGGRKLNVVQIGYGHLGKWHLQKIFNSEFINNVFLVDQSVDALKKAKVEYPNLEISSDISTVIDKVDAAIIVSPTSTHFDFLNYFLSQDKHVFCEKPLTETYQQSIDIEKLYEKKKNLVVQVGHSERFHKIWQDLGRWHDFFAGAVTARLERAAAFKGRATDVDCVQDLMIHDIDLMLYLLKEIPCAVRSTGYKIRTTKWDYACSDFYFKSGKKCTVIASRNHVEEVRKLDVTGGLGHLQVDLLRRKLFVASGSETSPEKFVETIEYEARDHLAIEQDHFYKSIIFGEPSIITTNDGVRALKLIDAVIKSLESGKETEVY